MRVYGCWNMFPAALYFYFLFWRISPAYRNFNIEVGGFTGGK
nr:MAG TPA: hypothetical protein [Bacteriophage sp.]